MLQGLGSPYRGDSAAAKRTRPAMRSNLPHPPCLGNGVVERPMKPQSKGRATTLRVRGGGEADRSVAAKRGRWKESSPVGRKRATAAPARVIPRWAGPLQKKNSFFGQRGVVVLYMRKRKS